MTHNLSFRYPADMTTKGLGLGSNLVEVLLIMVILYEFVVCVYGITVIGHAQNRTIGTSTNLKVFESNEAIKSKGLNRIAIIN